MKLKALISHLTLILAITNGYCQKASYLLSEWRGQYSEFNGKDTIKADYILKWTKTDGSKLIGTAEYLNFSNKAKNKRQAVVGEYGYDNGLNYVIMEHVAGVMKSSKSTNGALYLTVSQKGDKYQISGDFKSNDLMVDANSASIIATSVEPISKVAQEDKAKPLSSSVQQTNFIHLSSKPVLLDADEIYPFNDGFAVIQKGTSFAIINSKGSIVIPYNTYNFIYNHEVIDHKNSNFYRVGMPIDYYGFIKKRIVVQDTKSKLWGIMDDKLNLIVPCKYGYIGQVRNDGHYLARLRSSDLSDKAMLLLNKYGKVVMSGVNAYYLTGLNIQRNEKGKMGYVDNMGKVKIGFNYEKVTEFSEGLAAVAKNDEFGILKWGYIDMSGRTVIPFTFTNKPGSFHDNRALVEAAVKNEFDYAYINRRGEVVFKLLRTQTQYFHFGGASLNLKQWAVRENGSFLNGYAMWNRGIRNNSKLSGLMIVDTTGQMELFSDRLIQNGWPNANFSTQSEFVNNEMVISSRAGVKYDEIYAIVNIKGEIIVATTLKEGSVLGTIYSLFDENSGLAKAMIYDKNSNSRGYIDRTGEMKIMLAPKAKW